MYLILLLSIISLIWRLSQCTEPTKTKKGRDVKVEREDNQPVKLWAVQSKLREMLRTSTNKSVLVITDETIPVEKLIELVDQCRLSGAKDVAVAAQKEV